MDNTSFFYDSELDIFKFYAEQIYGLLPTVYTNTHVRQLDMYVFKHIISTYYPMITFLCTPTWRSMTFAAKLCNISLLPSGALAIKSSHELDKLITTLYRTNVL